MKIKYNSSCVLMLLLSAVLLTVSSCKKSFLEIDPKGKLVARTVSDYDLLLNNSELLHSGGANAHVFLSDEVAVVEPYFSAAEIRTQRLFKWEPTIYRTDEDAPETQTLLTKLYYYNKIINEIGDASGGTQQQKNSLRAEAQAGRAWVYFLLINYFGEPFHAETAATDQGFPIITVADVTSTAFARASVKEVYDFIVADLNNAIPDLPHTSHRMRMSRAAAEALLAKVYMFMQNFDDALPLLTNALNDIQQSEIPVELIDYNEAFAAGGLFTPLDPFFGPSTPTADTDPETIYARQFSNFWITTSELVISPSTVALFEASDLRLNFYSGNPFPFGDPYPGGSLRRMAPLVAGYGVALPDVILLRAECRARSNDLAGSVEDLERLRNKRMPASDAIVPASVSGDQQALLQFVLDERIREFASLGVRWFDMRRLSVDPLFESLEFKHQVIAEDGSIQEISLPKERLVLKIPPKILLENPGMQDNP